MARVRFCRLSSICCLAMISIVTGVGSGPHEIGGTHITFGTDSLTISTKAKAEDDHGRVVITFKSIKEVDESGAEVGVNDTHKVPSFGADIHVSEAMTDTYDNVSRTYFNAEMDASVGEMNITVSVYTQNGTVSEHAGNGTATVRVGMVEVQMIVGAWTFCGCESSGAYLDLLTNFKGNETIKKESDGYTYNLGNGAIATVKNMVAVDTVSVMQPAGYPVVTDSMFTFRTPIFQDSATFQFFIEVTADDNNVSNAYQQRPLSGVILLIVACLICYTCH